MSAIVVSIHRHEFEGFGGGDNSNDNDDLVPLTSSTDTVEDDDLPTNDSLDDDASSRPQFALVVADINNRNATDDDDGDTSMKDAESESRPTTPIVPDVDIDIDIDEDETTKEHLFGGLNNMGNTCYLNSALQMLASLDDFGERIKQPYENNTNTSSPNNIIHTNNTTNNNRLRESLVNGVLEKLQNGETVRPEDFKSVVDERSPLFIGYRQQDSHEFLTTLLDLLDEDFKKKDEEEEEKVEEEETKEQAEEQQHQQSAGESSAEEQQQQQPSSSQEEPVVADAVMEDASSSPNVSETEEETDESSYIVVEKEDLQSSPIKKQKLDDGSSSNEDETRTISSFIDLGFSDIENLLHGDKAETMTTAPGNNNKEHQHHQQEPKCKLVGGRMSAAGLQLTPLEDGSAVLEEAPAPAKAEAEEDAMSEEEEEEDTPESPIDYSFGTEVRVCLTCDSCKYRRSHTEKYLHLSLEIGENCSTIEDGLRKFFAPEKREIKCEKCFCESAMQTTEITRLPRAMLFHLKRFIVKVSPDYTSISYSKDQSAVSFEEDLPFGEDSLLSEYLATDVSLPEGGSNSSYKIRSVVNHIGSSASCGHYTADAFRRYDDDAGRQWTRFNDSIVSKISNREAIEDSARTAYMIMYEIGA